MKSTPPPLPYSKAIKHGSLLFVAGHIGIDPKTNKLSADFKKQTVQTLENLNKTLKDNNASFKDVLKTTVYLKNMDNYAILNEVYARYFQSPYPARSTVQVGKLPADADVEIDLIVSLCIKNGQCEDCEDCNC